MPSDRHGIRDLHGRALEVLNHSRVQLRESLIPPLGLRLDVEIGISVPVEVRQRDADQPPTRGVFELLGRKARAVRERR